LQYKKHTYIQHHQILNEKGLTISIYSSCELGLFGSQSDVVILLFFNINNFLD